MTISFNLPADVALGQAVDAIQAAETEMRLPATIRGSFSGTAQAFQESLANEPILIVAALLTVYIVLGVLYESLIHPVTILSTLPSAGVGALLALLITHNVPIDLSWEADVFGGSLGAEWGPAADDARHRVFGFGHWRVAGRLRLSGQVFAQSGTPWDAITGRDDNGDTVTSDRPAGATRNTARGDWTVDSGLRLTWDFGFGASRATGPRGPQMIGVRLGGDDGPPDIGGGPDDQRYGVQLYALASNILNHLNPTRYGSVVGSPLFGQPVEAVPGRRVEIGARFRF